jgi:hypothetical protein
MAAPIGGRGIGIPVAIASTLAIAALAAVHLLVQL